MEINKFMERIPGLVEQAINAAKVVSNGKIEISASLNSISKLDEVVQSFQNLWTKNLINDTVAWNSSVALGTLLGEMIINEHHYHWAINDGLPVVETDDHNQLSPITKIYKIITDEENCEGTPSAFYEGLLALIHYQSLSEESE